LVMVLDTWHLICFNAIDSPIWYTLKISVVVIRSRYYYLVKNLIVTINFMKER
jgi:hypothetical protein